MTNQIYFQQDRKIHLSFIRNIAWKMCVGEILYVEPLLGCREMTVGVFLSPIASDCVIVHTRHRLQTLGIDLETWPSLARQQSG